MIRIKAGAPRRATSRTNSRGPARAGLRARHRGSGLRAGLDRAVSRAERRTLRRVLSLGPPTAWGAIAITYKMTCPLAQRDGLEARIVTSAVFFAVGTGLILHVRRALLRELRQIRK